LHAQDTAELFFSDVRAPLENRLGEEGAGFGILMGKLAQEAARFRQSVASVPSRLSSSGLLPILRERKAFGHTPRTTSRTRSSSWPSSVLKPPGCRTFVDKSIEAFLDGSLSASMPPKSSSLAANLHCRAADECLQFFGGYGYVFEFPIARAFVDARVSKIAGGAVEVMKQIIGKDLFSRQ